MDNKVDKADQQNAKDIKILEDFLRERKTGVSISEITVGTGLAIHWVEPNLRELMKKYACHVEFNEQQALLYFFDFEQPLQESKWRKYFLEGLQFMLRILYFVGLSIWKLLGLILYVSFTISLFLVIIISMVPMLFLLPILRLFMSKNKIDKFYDESDEGAMKIIKAVFGENIWDLPSFFTFKLIKTDKLEIEKRLLALVSTQKGVILVSDIIKVTAWKLEKAKEEAVQLVANYQGEINLNQEGIIEYQFPHLESSEQKNTQKSWIWDRLYIIKNFNWDFYKKLFRGLLFAFINVALPLLIASVVEGKLQYLFILFFAFPLFPYLVAIIVMTLKMPWIFWRNQQQLKYNHKANILKITFQKLTQNESVSIENDFQSFLDDKSFIEEYLKNYNPDFSAKSDGSVELTFPDLLKETLWREKENN